MAVVVVSMVPAATTGKVFLEGMAAAVSAVATTFPAREEITADMVEMEAVVDPTDFRTVAVGGARLGSHLLGGSSGRTAERSRTRRGVPAPPELLTCLLD